MYLYIGYTNMQTERGRETETETETGRERAGERERDRERERETELKHKNSVCECFLLIPSFPPPSKEMYFAGKVKFGYYVFYNTSLEMRSEPRGPGAILSR